MGGRGTCARARKQVGGGGVHFFEEEESVKLYFIWNQSTHILRRHALFDAWQTRSRCCLTNTSVSSTSRPLTRCLPVQSAHLTNPAVMAGLPEQPVLPLVAK